MSGPGLDAWAAAVSSDLGLAPADCEVDTVLDLARDAAHGVMRPAAPLTTFLVGVAIGRGMAPDEAVARATRLAATWSPPEDDQDA
ncbi:DUF6457 domain-containing protein [Aestuariimicrobium soli]|uniref:DUF6457 domain-containing protein n=1 Tax=Aestuariimicrobium soli TaxID=2035834 RepID=UPI003EB8DB34